LNRQPFHLRQVCSVCLHPRRPIELSRPAFDHRFALPVFLGHDRKRPLRPELKVGCERTESPAALTWLLFEHHRHVFLSSTADQWQWQKGNPPPEGCPFLTACFVSRCIYSLRDAALLHFIARQPSTGRRSSGLNPSQSGA